MIFYKRLILIMTITICGLLSTQANATQSKIETRIIGGAESSSGEWPWMVALSFNGAASSALEIYCGASLINKDWLLTAAHCMYDEVGNIIDPASIRAYVGAYDLALSSDLSHEVTRIIVHPNYDLNTSDNDIALLRLSSPITSIAPVDLITDAVASTLQGLADDGKNDVSAIGWGNTGDDTRSQILRNVELQYISNAQCNTSLVAGQITENMLCAGVISGGVDSCQGDSGGPLVFYNNGRWYQAGIVSWGLGCAEVNSYGVYSRVNNYTHWIDLILNGYAVTPNVQFGSWLPALTTTTKVSINNFSATAPLGIDSLSINNPAFSVANDGCSPSVNIGETCDIAIKFVAGTTIGDISDALTINTDDSSIPQITVALKAGVVTQTYFNIVSASDEILWALGGDDGWTEELVTEGGGSSLQSGEVVNTQKSSLFAYVKVGVSGSRDMYFDWKVCSEPDWDYLELWVDNDKIDSIAGNVDWVNKSITLSGVGDHVIEWRYNKDYLATYGADVGWVDNISLDSASLNPLPIHTFACNAGTQQAEEPVPSIVPYVPPQSGGGAVSTWFSLGLGVSLLIRRRYKLQ